MPIVPVCGQQHFQQSMGQPGKVANRACGRRNRENIFPLSPFAPDHLVSETGSAVPCLVSSLIGNNGYWEKGRALFFLSMGLPG